MTPNAAVLDPETFPPSLGLIDTSDLIQALCDCGEWQLARDLAREDDRRRLAQRR